MYVEIPVVKRCCFCFPLRYGLLVGAYIKLAFLVLSLFTVSSSIYMVWKNFDALPKASIGMAVLIIVVTAIHISFIVAAHKKSFKLMRIALYYSIVEGVIGTLLYSLYLGYVMNFLLRFKAQEVILLTAQLWAIVFLNMVVQLYIVLLIRSEIVKLKNEYTFQFVNNAAEAECTLKSTGLDLKEEA